jgi:hypothetical protein
MAAQPDDMAGPRAADPVPDDDRIVLDDPDALAAEPDVAEPLATEHPGDLGDPSATSGTALTGDRPDTIPAAALAEQQWPSIQALFVDNPRGAVERAAAAAGEVAVSLIATLEREQAELRTSWPQDADTEDLRTALQRYRAFCGRLEGLA